MNNENKTEKPTAYKLKKNYELGKKIFFKELNTFIILLLTIIYIWFYKNIIVLDLINFIKEILQFNNFNFNYIILTVFIFLKKKIFFHFLIFFLIIFFVNVCIPLFFGNRLFNFNRIFLNYDKINFFQGLKNIVLYNNLYELFISIIKLIIVNIIYIIFFFLLYNNLFILPMCSFLNILSILNYIIYFFLMLLLLFYFPIVILDIFITKKNYLNYLNMTKTEVKEEKKFLEGNSLNKNRILKKINYLLKQNNISNLIYSDLVILDFNEKKIIALKYNIITKKIQLILKISGVIIFKIKKLSKIYNIPILSSPFLINILYKNINIGQNIPKIYYKEITEIIVWVLKVKKWEKYGGKYPSKPNFFLFHLL